MYAGRHNHAFEHNECIMYDHINWLLINYMVGLEGSMNIFLRFYFTSIVRDYNYLCKLLCKNGCHSSNIDSMRYHRKNFLQNIHN